MKINKSHNIEEALRFIQSNLKKEEKLRNKQLGRTIKRIEKNICARCKKEFLENNKKVEYSTGSMHRGCWFSELYKN